jgi:hypothetical protein
LEPIPIAENHQWIRFYIILAISITVATKSLLKRGLISHVFYRYIQPLFSHKLQSLSTRLHNHSLSVGWFQVNWSAGQGDPNNQMRPEIVDDILYAAVRVFLLTNSTNSRNVESKDQKKTQWKWLAQFFYNHTKNKNEQLA